MKKIFFILTISSYFPFALSMEKIIDKKTMNTYMEAALTALIANDLQEALYWYGKVADAYLPPAEYSGELEHLDPYLDQRRCKAQGFNKIAHEALRLKENSKYAAALKVYMYAPQSFENQIKAVKIYLLGFQRDKKVDAKM